MSSEKNMVEYRGSVEEYTGSVSKKTYDEALSALTDVLSNREKELDAREVMLQEVEKSLEVERSAIYGDTNPSDVLYLAVGGKAVIKILRRTLTSVPGSMLAAKFSGRWDDSLEKDKNGNFFIDQDYSLFYPMINYLRNQSNGTETYPPRSPILKDSFGEGNTLADFYRMVEYYGMTDGIYPTRLVIIAGTEDSVDFIHPMKVNAKEWTTFELSRFGHNRDVKSYEITLGENVKRIQIGWNHVNGTVPAITFGTGIGDITNTSAIDFTRSCYLLNGIKKQIDHLEHQKGTVVRSENYGSDWYVDGEMIRPTLNNAFSTTVKGIVPYISIKGEMEVTAVKLFETVA